MIKEIKKKNMKTAEKNSKLLQKCPELVIIDLTAIS